MVPWQHSQQNWKIFRNTMQYWLKIESGWNCDWNSLQFYQNKLTQDNSRSIEGIFILQEPQRWWNQEVNMEVNYLFQTIWRLGSDSAQVWTIIETQCGGKYIYILSC